MPDVRWTVRILCYVLCVGRWLWYVCVSVEFWYVGWGCALCRSVLWQAGVSLCEERHVVGEGASVDSIVGVQEVLLYSMCCISAHSVVAFVTMLVLYCRGFSPCFCVCMFRAVDLQGWAFV